MFRLSIFISLFHVCLFAQESKRYLSDIELEFLRQNKELEFIYCNEEKFISNEDKIEYNIISAFLVLYSYYKRENWEGVDNVIKSFELYLHKN